MVSLDIYHCHTFRSFLAFLYGAAASQVDLVQLSIVLTLKATSNREEDRAEAPPRPVKHGTPPACQLSKHKSGQLTNLKNRSGYVVKKADETFISIGSVPCKATNLSMVECMVSIEGLKRIKLENNRNILV
ncbi:hypothetical protein MUK42_32534 [Musa troglodytarum]|uniref:Uncharacterized protein n=1 Tax=Musa troglodytarum TaxID=320322 RepID=A0A9E7HWR6_9LILI|nr:hypothetical protein MUK42_32534 [Musa troglodytarum]